MIGSESDLDKKKKNPGTYIQHVAMATASIQADKSEEFFCSVLSTDLWMSTFSDESAPLT